MSEAPTVHPDSLLGRLRAQVADAAEQRGLVAHVVAWLREELAAQEAIIAGARPDLSPPEIAAAPARADLLRAELALREPELAECDRRLADLQPAWQRLEEEL